MSTLIQSTNLKEIQSCINCPNTCCNHGPIVTKEEQVLFKSTEFVDLLDDDGNVSSKYKQMKPTCEFFNSVNQLCTCYDKRPIDCRLYPFAVTPRGIAIDCTCPLVKTMSVHTLHRNLVEASKYLTLTHYADAVMDQLSEILDYFYFIEWKNIDNWPYLQAAIDRAKMNFFHLTDHDYMEAYWDSDPAENVIDLLTSLKDVPIGDRNNLSLFDLGCAGGKFIYDALASGINAYGIETYYPVLMEGVQRMPELKHRTVYGDFLVELPIRYLQEQFDIVYTSQSFAQYPIEVLDRIISDISLITKHVFVYNCSDKIGNRLTDLQGFTTQAGNFFLK